MSGAMLHGLGGCTPVLNCGCIGTGDARRPPSRAVIEAVEQAMAAHFDGGANCVCGFDYWLIGPTWADHMQAEVAKAAMDAARPIILREAAALLRREYGSGHAGAVAWIEDRAAKAYEIDADDTDGEHSHRPYDDGEPYGEVCDCEIGDDHDATGEGQ